MSRSGRRTLSRRQFLKTTAAVGLVATTPGLLAGCGDGSDDPRPAPTPSPTPTVTRRERRTLQFDLSHNGELREARLGVLNSGSYRARLRQHTAKSRARFRRLTPALNAIADAHLTHYVEDVDLPADALQLVTVTGTTSSGAAALLGAYIHIPTATLADYAAGAMAGTAPMPTALLQQYGVTPTAASLADLLTLTNAYVTPLTTATALCFHHPELMNLNTRLGANTLIGFIQNLPSTCTDPTEGCKFIDGAAFWIATHSPATTTPGGWATLVVQTDADDQPVVGPNGEPVYRYDLTDATRDQLAPPVRAALAAVFDDTQYEGTNWNATSGLTAVDQSASSAAASPRIDDDSFVVQATLPVGSTHNGIEFVSLAVSDPATRSAQLTIRNRYLRWLRAYAQFFTPEGMALPVADPGPDDTVRAKFLGEVTSNNQIMGIPLMGNDVARTTLGFTFPAAASRARIILGSLGLGGEAFCPEALVGSALTLAFNIGMPTLLLSWGIGETASSGISVLANNQALRSAIVGALRMFLVGTGASYAVGIYGSETSQDAICFISALANSLIQALLTSVPLFVQYLAIQGAEQAVAAVPIVGWIFKGLEIAATLAAIAVAVGEVLSSEALTNNDVTLSFDMQVTIEHDADDVRFPPEADTYEVTATLAKTVVYKTSGAITPPGGQRTAPIVATLTGIPSGGDVTVDVVLKSSDGWIAATASAGPLPATPEAAGALTLAVTNRLVPLTAETQYQHDLLLEFAGGAHAWTQAPAPAATRAALSCADEQTLCQLGQIAHSPTTGMLGYAWRTGGLGVDVCGDGAPGILFAFQNVFEAAPPDAGLKFPGCGFLQPATLAYDPKGPPSGTGNNFFLAPALDGDGFALRAVTLDQTTPFDVLPMTNWGRFTQTLDSIAVHPSGYVAGVATATHKLEILTLPDGAATDGMPAQATWATMRAGLGTRAGLLSAPVAVTVHDGALLVLEQGNLRIQAFDVTANPVPRFAGGTSPFAPLVSESPTPVYLDLAADALGYLYVLSYTGDGTVPADYRLDIYQPDGTFLVRTTGIAAARMTVGPFRTLYALNYAPVAGAPRVEPSLSQWLPSTPGVA